jgi:hypothetical protein
MHCQKLLKLADSSEHGWKVVEEYEAHPLAENSDDEKKIYRAQMQADRKVRQERRNRAKRYTPYSTDIPTRGSSAAITQTSQIQNRSTWSRKPGTCFKCGKPGHWRAEYRAVPAVRAETAQSESFNKISNNLLFFENNECKHLINEFNSDVVNKTSNKNVTGRFIYYVNCSFCRALFVI